MNEKKKGKVDDAITAISGEWKFSDEVAKHFDSHVRKSVPLYDEIQRMVVEMSEWFIHDGSTVYDLGLSTGETIIRLQGKHSTKQDVTYIGIDNSEFMIERAKTKILEHKNLQLLCQNIEDVQFREADFVISLYTMQFLRLKDRHRVLKEIFKNLNEGGAFVMVEKIQASNALFEDLWLELYWDMKKRNKLTADQILNKAGSIRGVLRPLTLSENIELLHLVGFTNVDLFFKWYNWAGIIAIKKFEGLKGE